MSPPTDRSSDTVQPLDPEKPVQLPFMVVGVGASAGCVDALVRLFENLPKSSGMAFVVVVHLAPEHESTIDEVVGRVTSMPVRQVRKTTSIEPDHVYVISPALSISLVNGALHVAELQRVTGRLTAIDGFFRSLGIAQGPRAACVVLSGMGSDGSAGLRLVKEYGGVALAQLPDEAEYRQMPSNAIATGAVDFVLPVAEIGSRLVSHWQNAQRIELPGPPGDELLSTRRPLSEEAAHTAEEALTEILQTLRAVTGHDFRHYKRATILRRLERRLQVSGLPNLIAYRDYLLSNVDEPQALLADLLISVTNFFRDPEAFEALDLELQARSSEWGQREAIRTWVAACATGEEAYSVGMVMSDVAAASGWPVKIQVFASDIDERAIAIGRAGSYAPGAVDTMSPDRATRYFIPHGEQVKVKKELRDRVLFAVHNLLRDPPFSGLDLVCCRNLLIYLEREVQLQVLRLFHFALRPGGLLFLGRSESVEGVADLFQPIDKKNRIYRAEGPRAVRRPTSTEPFGSFGESKQPLRPDLDAQNTLQDLHDRLRQDHAAPSALVDVNAAILHSSPRASEFLMFVPGSPSRNLLDAVRPELRFELRTALSKAWRDGVSGEARGVRLRQHGEVSWVTLTVRPVKDSPTPLMLVFFDRSQATLQLRSSGDESVRDPMILVMEEELQRTRDQLQGSIGDSAASTEELHAANDELQAINEELRSATEELEISKEELHSVNEELIAVNHELEVKVDETSRANDDLNNLISSTDIATVFVDRHLNIKRYTPRATQLFNLIESDTGRSLLDITHRLDYPDLERDMREAFDSLRSVRREVSGPDDQQFLVRTVPYRTRQDVIYGAVLTFVDITEVRQAQAQVREGAINLQLLVERTEDYIVITTDPAGSVTSWNEGAHGIFGYDEREIVGRPIDVIFTPEDRAAGAPKREMDAARTTGRALDERWHMAKSGRACYVSGITTPLYENGALLGFAKIARDRTEAKQTEDRLVQMLAQEKNTRAELQRAIALKDEFLAVMSHELKHPLNLIHVNAELLLRLPSARQVPGVSRAAEVIRRTVLGQAKIIDDLLDMSRLRTGKLTLTTGPLVLADLVERVLEAAADDACRAGLTIVDELDPSVPPIEADAVRVEQIVWNLVSNALKFTPSGGSIRVVLSVDADQARLDVIDTGRGIDTAFLGDAFEMFRQADRTTTRSQGGMGIGLALVMQLAEAHGGRVAVASEGIGKGSAFSVWLPLAQGSSACPEPANVLPALSGYRVLVVDDVEDALTSFALLLEIEGAEVVAVDGAAAALKALAQGRFDLLLSDVAMPEMDGYALIEAVRRDPKTTSISAIALTGFGRFEDQRKALDAGFDAHVKKPVVIEDLLGTIHDLKVRQP